MKNLYTRNANVVLSNQKQFTNTAGYLLRLKAKRV